MKRVSKRQRTKTIRRIRAILRRRRRLRIIENHREFRRIRFPRTHQPAIRVEFPTDVTVEMEDERHQLMICLAFLRFAYHESKGRTVFLDFSKTKRFVASGTLLLFAELSRLIGMTKGTVRLRCNEPKSQRASEVLTQIGIYSLCGRTPRRKPTRSDVVHWRVAHGHRVDNSICAPTIEAFEGQLAEPLVNGILGGLGEAMTNAVHHAYIDIRQDGMEYAPPQKDWWLFSQSRDGFLAVVFCDLGVGIPNTLPSKQPALMAAVLKLLGRSPSDAECIEAAVEDSRSRTRQSGRGHGLGDIISVVEQIPKGTAIVFSNRGGLFVHNRKVTKFDYKVSILGTLIFWRVPLDGASSYGG